MRVLGLLAMMVVGFALPGCDGRPLLSQIMPSQTDLDCLAAFEMIDAAHKGQLTREETDAYFKRRFGELDVNHDGFLDETEAQRAVPIFGMKTGANMVFRLDINGDGRLSQDEFVRLSNYLFTRDYNRDGVLTLAEVKMPPTDNFVAAGTTGVEGRVVGNK